ncbi:MAG: hypothetical protein U0183_31170 [Polyangiaceae bacterium]
MPRSFTVPLFLFAGAALSSGLSAACSSPTDASSPPPASIFVAPAALSELSGEAFFDHPFPSDLRRDETGHAVYEGFYSPFESRLIADYVKATKGLLRGFSPAAAIHLRFSADVDPASLPADPGAAKSPTASVQLVDIDPKSPERGKRRPIETSFRAAKGVYIPKDTLAVLPMPGAPLLPSTRYALVVTRALRSTDGRAFEPSSDLAEVLGETPPTSKTEKVRAAYGDAVTELAAAGIPKGDVAHLTVFTTNDPTDELFRVVDAMKSQVKAPVARDIVAKDQAASYDVYEGMYGPTPSYQAGTVPFAQQGGAFTFDDKGVPVLQGTFDVRFAIVIPNAQKCPEPEAGYPVVIYAHGTGGDYRSIMSKSVGPALAEACLATVGTDQIFHGTRPGAPPDSDPNKEGNTQLLFFNLNNPTAARTNGRQSAVDVAQEARLFTETGLVVPAAVARSGKDVKLDGKRVTFYGHSQGGLNGPLYLAADPSSRGGVLSGTGSLITIALLEKTEPKPSVAGALRVLLSLTDPEEGKELDLFHPVVNLAQAMVDTTDPIHYMGRIIQRPREGFAPKSIFETEGIGADGVGDSYAPPHGIEVGAVALGLPRQAPGLWPIREAKFAGLGDVTVPAEGLVGNLAGGKASGVLAQYAPKPGSDGHFVAYDVPEAKSQIVKFLRNLADDPRGKVSPP